MKTWSMVIASVAISLALPAAAEESRPHDRRPPPHEIVRAHSDELGLDDATLAEVIRILKAAHPELHRLHLALRSARTQHGPEAPETQRAIQALRAREKQLTVELRRILDDEAWEALRALLPPPHPRPATPEARP